MGVPYEEVAERLKAAGGCKNDSALARELGVTPQALSNYKKRGEFPADLAIKAADRFIVSLDWALRGEGEGPDLGAVLNMPGCKPSEQGPTSLSMSISPEEAEVVLPVIKALRGQEVGMVKGVDELLDKYESAIHP